MAAVGVVFVATVEAVEAASAAGGLVYFVAVPRVPPHLDPKISAVPRGYRMPRVEIAFLCLQKQAHDIQLSSIYCQCECGVLKCRLT